jgi:hypothetical protein
MVFCAAHVCFWPKADMALGGLFRWRGTPSRAERRFRSAMTGELPKYGAVLVLVVRSLHTTVFHGVAHIAKHKDREGCHALPLFGTKSFVEWLPRLSELIQIS